MRSLPLQIHENFHSNYNLKLQLLSPCLPSAEKRGILGRIWSWSHLLEEARRSEQTATASIFPWDLTRLSSASTPGLQCLQAPSHSGFSSPDSILPSLPPAGFFPSLVPLALPGHVGLVTNLFVPGHSPPFSQSEGQRSLPLTGSVCLHPFSLTTPT